MVTVHFIFKPIFVHLIRGICRDRRPRLSVSNPFNPTPHRRVVVGADPYGRLFNADVRCTPLHGRSLIFKPIFVHFIRDGVKNGIKKCRDFPAFFITSEF